MADQIKQVRKALELFASKALESRDNWKRDDGQMRESGEVPKDADASVSITQGELDTAEDALAALRDLEAALEPATESEIHAEWALGNYFSRSEFFAAVRWSERRMRERAGLK